MRRGHGMNAVEKAALIGLAAIAVAVGIAIPIQADDAGRMPADPAITIEVSP